MVLILKRNAKPKEIDELRKKLKSKAEKGSDTKKYCGVIKLKEYPLKIQQKMRNEWQ